MNINNQILQNVRMKPTYMSSFSLCHRNGHFDFVLENYEKWKKHKTKHKY